MFLRRAIPPLPSTLWRDPTGNGKPGRKCSNGRSVPLSNPDWAKLVQGVRAAGISAYNAAKAKDQDKILDAADVMTTACSNCHDKYREVAGRCFK